MPKVVSTITRPDASVIERFKKVRMDQVAKLVPAGSILASSIKPLALRNVKIVGPAVTVAPDGADLMMGVLSTGVAQAGDVIVVAADGDDRGAAWGGGLTLSADNLGCAGVIVDGLVMDSASVVERATPVFGNGTTLLGRMSDTPGSINVEVTCGGATVRPGDIVMGDLDGVFVVPQDQAEEILAKAEAISEKINAGAAKMAESKSTMFQTAGGRDLATKLGVDWE